MGTTVGEKGFDLLPYPEEMLPPFSGSLQGNEVEVKEGDIGFPIPGDDLKLPPFGAASTGNPPVNANSGGTGYPLPGDDRQTPPEDRE